MTAHLQHFLEREMGTEEAAPAYKIVCDLPLAQGTSQRLVLTAVDGGVALDCIDLYDFLEESNTRR